MSTAEPSHLVWFKSSYSGNEGGACIEVAVEPRAVYVRDSKTPSRAQLAFHRTEWAAFVRYATQV